MSALEWCRKNWPKVGIVASGAAAGLLALKGGSMDRSRALTIAAAATLHAHQFEEYIYPGWFPGLLNGEIMKSDQPANYPGNTQSVLIINTALAYPFMLLPVVFPNSKKLGLARYTPGEATSLLLWLPIGIAWVGDQRQNHGGFSRADVLAAILLVATFAGGGIQGPIQLFKDTPYAFEQRQVTVP